MTMKLLTGFFTACVLALGVANADAQDRFVYRPHFGVMPNDPLPLLHPDPQDRFVHRPNYGAVRQGVLTRTPTYAEYYLRKHNQLPPYGNYAPREPDVYYWR